MARKALSGLIVGILITGSTAGRAVEPRALVITKGQDTVLTGPYTYYLVDDDDKVALDGAQAAWDQGKFAPIAERASGGIEYLRGKLWLRLELTNVDHATSDWVLNCFDGISPEAEIIMLDQTGQLISTRRFGTELSQDEKSMKERLMATRVHLAKGEHRIIYMWLRNHTVSGLGQLQTPAAHYELAAGINTRLAAYFAVCIVMIAYNIFLYISLRYIFYLEYVAFIGGMAFTIFTNFALSNYFFGPTIFPVHYAHAYRSVALITALLFTRNFLRTRELMPRVDQLLKVEMVLGAVTLVLNFTPARRYFATVIDLLTLIFCFQAVVFGTLAWRKGHRAALFYLASWSGMVTCVVVWLLAVRGVFLQFEFFDQFLPLYGQMLEMIVISLGLGDHINSLIQQKKIAEVKAAETEKQRVLLRVISQDLSRPLSLIRGHAERFSQVSGQAHGSRRSWEETLAATQEQKSIIDHVREMEAVFTGKRRVGTTAVALTPLLIMLPGEFAPALASKRIKLVVNLPDDPLVVRADGASLAQHVFHAIVSNAIKFSPEGSEVTVTAVARGGVITIAVEDQGIGMTKALNDVLFDPFKRGSRLGTSGEHGIGFGMPIAKSYIVQFGGSVTVESRSAEEYPGRHGTTVRVTLRAAKSSKPSDFVPPPVNQRAA